MIDSSNSNINAVMSTHGKLFQKEIIDGHGFIKTETKIITYVGCGTYNENHFR